MSDKSYTVEFEIDGCRRPSGYRQRYIVVEWTRGEEREVTDE